MTIRRRVQAFRVGGRRRRGRADGAGRVRWCGAHPGWRAVRMGLVLVVGAVVAAEVAHHRASRAYLGRGAAVHDDAVEAVVVLGFADPGRSAGLVNRRRVAYALRSQRGRRSTLVTSGGAVAGPVPEAELLAAHARALGYGGDLVTETGSRSTWENVRNVIPLIEHAQRIVVVSDAVHAAKARYYLHMQRPDLAARLAPADDHRLGEDLVLKVPTAVLGLIDLARARRLPGPRHGGRRRV
ncbi:YdcF family protein [Actinomyces howellii]|nr:YdcF family protein [Actinomyces howellii]